jgi:hypothetical protein
VFTGRGHGPLPVNRLEGEDYEQAQEVHQVITGSLDTALAKLKRVIDVVNPAWLVLWAREGPMSHTAAMRCLELLGKEVIPAIKEYQPSHETGTF